MTTHNDVFGARATLEGVHGTVTYYHLGALAQRGIQGLERLPFTVKIILENALRYAGIMPAYRQGGFLCADT